MHKRTASFLVLSLLIASGPIAAQEPAAGAGQIITAESMAVSPKLSDIVPVASSQAEEAAPRQIVNAVKFTPPGPRAFDPQAPDLLLQASSAPTSPLNPTPAPLLSFDGTSDDDNAAVIFGRIVPPDTEGDVGPNHYFQMNNLVFEIFDKSGTSLLGPLANNSIWAALGGSCANENDGDPIVLYDHLADRWMVSQFAIDANGHQCIAISQTPDPTGAYFLYDFIVSPLKFNDYPKLGVWPDAYYMTANEFQGSFRSAIAVAFDRASMLAGGAGTGILFDITSGGGNTYFGVQPSHWEGSNPPPVGSPNTFVMSFDDQVWGTGINPDRYELWEFVVDWSGGAHSFTQIAAVNTTAFDANLCGFAECATQPAPGELLDTLSQFTMYRASYRNLDGTETIVGTHTVDVGSNRAGVRWYELRKTGPATWALHQTGTYAPADGEHRWMGSAAMDSAGNIAVAYSVSSTATNPAVRYNTRGAGDALGTLPGGEVSCVEGGGVQTGSFGRWGDYSTVSVDPTDECTFWITNEYYSTTGSFDFNTRICSFKMPNCGEQQFQGIVGLPNIGGSASPDVGVAVPGSTRVHIRDGSTDALISDINFGTDPAYDMIVIPDLNASGDPEIGVLGMRPSGQIRLQTKDSGTGASTGNAFYGDVYSGIEAAVVADFGVVGIPANGLPEVAVLGQEPGTDKIRIMTRDVFTDTGLKSVFLGDKMIAHHLVAVDDVTGAPGVQEVLAMGVVKASNQIMSPVRDAETAGLHQTLFWANQFEPIKTLTIADINGGGAPEIVAVGMDPGTNAVRLQIRDVTTRAPITTEFLGAAGIAVDAAIITDTNANGFPDVAVLTETIATSAALVRVYDTSTGDLLKNVFYNTLLDPVGLAVLTDYSAGGLGFDELAVLGTNGGNRQVQIKDSKDGTLVNSIDFP